jgi:hypothetical protein
MLTVVTQNRRLLRRSARQYCRWSFYTAKARAKVGRSGDRSSYIAYVLRTWNHGIPFFLIFYATASQTTIPIVFSAAVGGLMRYNKTLLFFFAPAPESERATKPSRFFLNI